MNTVATTPQDNFVLVPEAQANQIANLDFLLQRCRADIQSSGSIMRAVVTAQAVKRIEEAIGDEMMTDLKNLANHQMGFKTDRPPGAKDRQGKALAPYSDQTIKRCIIVALLAGATITGNQFNIIAGQCYFTKEFMRSFVVNFPGVQQFKWEIGPAKQFGDNTAIMSGRASWMINGEEFEIVCDNPEGGLDTRIVVRSFRTDGPDMLRGKGESKLLRRVASQLSGLNFQADENELTASTIELTPGDDAQQKTSGAIVHEEKPQPEPEPGPADSESIGLPESELDSFLDDAAMMIDTESSVVGVSKAASAIVAEMDQLSISRDQRDSAEKTVATLKATKIKQIRAERNQ